MQCCPGFEIQSRTRHEPKQDQTTWARQEGTTANPVLPQRGEYNLSLVLGVSAIGMLPRAWTEDSRTGAWSTLPRMGVARAFTRPTSTGASLACKARPGR